MKTTAEMIEVMQAFERGEKIECCSLIGFDWMPTLRPYWDWKSTDYRIKPRDPRVMWVNEYADGRICIHGSQAAAFRSATNDATRTAVKYIEVIE